MGSETFNELCAKCYEGQEQVMNSSQTVGHLFSPEEAHLTFLKVEKFDVACDD